MIRKFIMKHSTVDLALSKFFINRKFMRRYIVADAPLGWKIVQMKTRDGQIKRWGVNSLDGRYTRIPTK